MPPTPATYFLGGYDLEMITIRDLLRAEGADVCDRGLRWGATASAYRAEIDTARAAGRACVLIELGDDLPADYPRSELVWIDHHGPLAGADRPTALEQVFARLGLPPERWTRDFELVAANDRGHLAALERLGATPGEMRDIRTRDRRAQGVTPEHDEQARAAAARAERHCGGRLVVVRLPHGHTSAVADALDERLGGPGCENLLVFAPTTTIFFGIGRAIDALRVARPGGWYGGELPARGYWGFPAELEPAELLSTLGTAL